MNTIKHHFLNQYEHTNKTKTHQQHINFNTLISESLTGFTDSTMKIFSRVEGTTIYFVQGSNASAVKEASDKYNLHRKLDMLQISTELTNESPCQHCHLGISCHLLIGPTNSCIRA